MFEDEATEIAGKMGYSADSVGCEAIRQGMLAAYEKGKQASQHSVEPEGEHVHAKNSICAKCHPELEKLAPPRR